MNKYFGLHIHITTIVLLQIILISAQFQRQSSIRGSERGLRARKPSNQCSRNYNIDYIVFSLQWPPSFCWEKQSCNRHLNHNQWLIHGLWPQRRTGEWPEFCCSETDYSSRTLEPIKDQLMQKWKTLKADAKHDNFWKHEWAKHGTCAQSLNQFKGQLGYFNTTLQLYDLFPLDLWLNKSGIKATNGRQYSLNTIHEAIETQLKSRIRIECGVSPDSVVLMTELHICLDKTSLQPINCERRDDRQCGNHLVTFPSHS